MNEYQYYLSIHRYESVPTLDTNIQTQIWTQNRYYSVKGNNQFLKMKTENLHPKW